MRVGMGGGNRRELTYQGRGRRQRRWMKRMGERGDRGEERKNPGLGNQKRKYNVAKLTNTRHSIVYLWPLCRVWNTTTLLCRCHWDTKAGREEEVRIVIHDIKYFTFGL